VRRGPIGEETAARVELTERGGHGGCNFNSGMEEWRSDDRLGPEVTREGGGLRTLIFGWRWCGGSFC
jgi:hypothetical protein